MYSAILAQLNQTEIKHKVGDIDDLVETHKLERLKFFRELESVHNNLLASDLNRLKRWANPRIDWLSDCCTLLRLIGTKSWTWQRKMTWKKVLHLQGMWQSLPYLMRWWVCFLLPRHPQFNHNRCSCLQVGLPYLSSKIFREKWCCCCCLWRWVQLLDSLYFIFWRISQWIRSISWNSTPSRPWWQKQIRYPNLKCT